MNEDNPRIEEISDGKSEPNYKTYKWETSYKITAVHKGTKFIFRIIAEDVADARDKAIRLLRKSEEVE